MGRRQAGLLGVVVQFVRSLTHGAVGCRERDYFAQWLTWNSNPFDNRMPAALALQSNPTDCM